MIARAQVTIHSSALEACTGSEGIVIATEWDEFALLDWQSIYDSMAKPAFVFDGRLILSKERANSLRAIGFRVECIGRGVEDA